MSYETVLFDFHGVLCCDYLFSSLQKTYPELYDFVQTEIFGNGGEIGDKWMRGGMNVAEINQHISKNTSIDVDLLSELLVQGIGDMTIDRRLTDLAQGLVLSGRKVALVTDNMDIFNTVTVSKHGLDKVFPVIVNSCDYGMMKHEHEGRLFDIALEKLGVGGYDRTLLIDDSIKVRPIFEKKGGEVFTFETYEKFEPWIREKMSEKFIF